MLIEIPLQSELDRQTYRKIMHIRHTDFLRFGIYFRKIKENHLRVLELSIKMSTNKVNQRGLCYH